ncbi:hypothetical protein IAI10_19015 [Clostridium sp. 19966]|uniref:hypothetical protein n=1 Tax=Clostridium sp. 19966 TaxID=2768166 RepID=UPI0028DE81A8|nr:hypothetical protein [Clostridium sp. 19966]MDT8718753.1 hypothetical protein [Clostridium sp. 19966]
MKNIKKVRVIGLTAITLLVCQLALVSYLKSNEVPKEKTKAKASSQDIVNSNKNNNSISEDDSVKISDTSAKSIDISKISISDYEDKLIKKADAKNYKRNIENYKKVLVQFSVDEGYRDEIDKLIAEGNNMTDIFTAYDFLNDNYGMLKDLEMLLQEKRKGANWTNIFSKYKAESRNFKPSDFSAEYLNKLLGEYKLTAEDIMLADRVSQLSGKKFEDIIENKRKGKTWSEIKKEIGIINLQADMERVSIASNDVKKYVGENFSQQQAMDALVMAKKLNKEANVVVNEIKAGKTQEDIYAEYYAEKYN